MKSFNAKPWLLPQPLRSHLSGNRKSPTSIKNQSGISLAPNASIADCTGNAW